MHEYMDQVVELINLSQNRPLNELVYEGLRKAIILGVIPVGAHINEKAYADFMNISRTPMRMAIDRLKIEGIIEYIPNFGVTVKRVTVSDAEEIYKIRIALDTLASITAMDLMTSEDERKMDDLLLKTRSANDAGDVQTVIKYFKDFNDLIYEFARMPRLKIVVNQLREYLTRFRDISLLANSRRSKAFNEHELIYYCLKKKDENLVERIIEEHLNYSKEFIIEEILRAEQELNESIESQSGSN